MHRRRHLLALTAFTFSICAAAPALRAQERARVPGVPAGMAEIAAGYVAKVVCSGIFVSHRELASLLAQELAPDTPLDRLLRALVKIDVDDVNATVTARVMGVARTAVYREGLGATLVIGTTAEKLRAAAPAAAKRSDHEPQTVAWSQVEEDPAADPERLEAALAFAFREQARGPRARTRAVVVVHGGRLVAERYARGFTRDMPLGGWSMTKSVVHALVGIRVRQGKLRLEAPAGLPAWSGKDDPRAAITLDQLLRMSSGLRWNESYFDPSADAPRMLFASPGAAAYAARVPLAHAPGTQWKYASGTTNLICQILRETFGDDEDYLAFPRRELFGPLAMHSAVLEPDPSGTFVGSSFMLATARDWARFGLLYLQGGICNGARILPEGWVQSATTPAPADPRGHYGRHWWLNAGPPGKPAQRPAPELPADLFWASGFQGQSIAVIPSRGLVVVRLGCTKVARAWDRRKFLKLVLAAFDR